MATRSSIILKRKDGSYNYVYCHWDGYLDHNGLILQKYYSIEARVIDLLSFGDISSLQKNIRYHETESVMDTTTFYCRDRGENGCMAKTSNILPKNGLAGSEYRYMFKDNKWYVSEYGGAWKNLERELTKRGIM